MEYGETISRTGSMLVSADAGFVVKQDNVRWTPVGSVDGAVQYVVGSTGRVSILVDDREVFFFVVSFEKDFEYTGNTLNQVIGENVVDTVRGDSGYCQARFVGNAERLYLLVQPSSMDVSALMELDTSCNQDVEVSKSVFGGTRVRYDLRNIDTSTYLQFSVGNVLLGFVSPA